MTQFIKKCKLEILLFLAASLMWAGVATGLSFLTQYITQTVMDGKVELLPVIICLVTVYWFLDMLSDFAASHSAVMLRSKISMLFRNALVRRIERCRPEEKENNGDAHYLSMLNNDVSEVERSYLTGILMVIQQILCLIFSLGATIFIEPKLAVITVLLSVFPIVVPKLLQKPLEKLNREALQSKSEYINLLKDLLEGFLTLKIFRRYNEFNTYHDTSNFQMYQKTLHSYKWKRIAMSLSYGMGNMVVLTSWVLGAAFVLWGSISLPQMIALTSLMAVVAGPFQIISEYYTEIIAGRAIKNDLLDFLNEDEDNTYLYSDSRIECLELQNVSVIRNDTAILSGINFTMHAGEKVCLVGSSGSGKTTILKAIAGIYSVQKGSVQINSTKYDCPDSLTHPKILYLPQETVVFSASIKNNISLFRNCKNHVIIEAIRKAGLADWFRQSGRNVERMLQKENANLSGGELRRLDFARAMVEPAEILLFDEPTSGLDAMHSRNIMDQICSTDGKAAVVATHNLGEENIRRFDRVYVVHQGTILACGTPEEILHDDAFLSLQQGD